MFTKKIFLWKMSGLESRLRGQNSSLGSRSGVGIRSWILHLELFQMMRFKESFDFFFPFNFEKHFLKY